MPLSFPSAGGKRIGNRDAKRLAVSGPFWEPTAPDQVDDALQPRELSGPGDRES
jgi:hypothetical protein